MKWSALRSGNGLQVVRNEKGQIKYDLTYGGETHSLTEWSKKIKIDPKTISKYLHEGVPFAEFVEKVFAARKRRAEERYYKSLPKRVGGPKKNIPFQDVIRAMSLASFIDIFLRIKFKGKYVKWKLYPEQRKLCDAIDKAGGITDEVFWLLKSRQSAGTEIVAALTIKRSIENNDFATLCLSKEGTSAEEFLKDRIDSKLQFLREDFPSFPWPLWRTIKGSITFSNGSKVSALSSANHAGRGKTVDLVILDEAAAGEFEHHAEAIWQSIEGTTEHSANGFKVVLSTSNPGTWFNRRSKELYEEGKKGRKVPGFTFFFLGRNSIPGRNDSWCEKKIEKLGQVGFQLEYPAMPDDCFVRKEGFVFEQFENPPGRHKIKVELDFGLQLIFAYDHGNTKEHPAVLLCMLYDRFKDHLHVFHEIFWFAEGLDAICKKISEAKEWLKKKYNAPRPQKLIADTAIINNDGRKSIRDTIYSKTGLYFTGAHKHGEQHSLNLLIIRINENKLSIDPSCFHTSRQIQNLLWNPRNGKPIDLDNDACDVLRYVCYEVNAGGTRSGDSDKPLEAYSSKARKYREENSFLRPQRTESDSNWMGF